MYTPLVVPLPAGVAELVAQVEGSSTPLALLGVALAGYRAQVESARDIRSRARRCAGQRLGGHEHRVLLGQVERVWPREWRRTPAELGRYLGDGSWGRVWHDAVAATVARDRLGEAQYRMLMAPMSMVLDPPDWATQSDWVGLWKELTTTMGGDAARAAVSKLAGTANARG